MKRFQFITCKVMQREAYFCAARSKNVVDVVLMEQGLHDEPTRLRREVQKALDNTCDIQGRPYEASLLGYGLCSNGIVGLSAQIPIVVPRGHDCITLLLGSKEKYGHDNAQYLMEVEQDWIKQYGWATYIDWGFADSNEYRDYAKRCAEFLRWSFDELKGSPVLMQKLVDGNWDDSEFLIVKPGHKIDEDLTNDGIIRAK